MGREAWSTFEVEFIKVEVDHQCEGVVSGVGGGGRMGAERVEGMRVVFFSSLVTFTHTLSLPHQLLLTDGPLHP